MLFIERRRLFVQPCDFIPDLPDSRFNFLRALASRAFSADLFAQPFPVGVALLKCGLSPPPFPVDSQQLIDLRGIVAAASREPASHEVRLFTDEADIEHGLEYQRTASVATVPHLFLVLMLVIVIALPSSFGHEHEHDYAPSFEHDKPGLGLIFRRGPIQPH